MRSIVSDDPRVKKVREKWRGKSYWRWNGKMGNSSDLNDYYWVYSDTAGQMYNEAGKAEGPGTKAWISTIPFSESTVKLRGYDGVPIKDWSGSFGAYGCAMISEYLNLVNFGLYRVDDLGFAQFAVENLVDDNGKLCAMGCTGRTKRRSKTYAKVSLLSGDSDYVNNEATLQKMLLEADIITFQMGKGYVVSGATHYMPLLKSQDGWTIMDFNDQREVGEKSRFADFWKILKASGDCPVCKPITQGVFIGRNAKVFKWLWVTNRAANEEKKLDGAFLNIFAKKVK